MSFGYGRTISSEAALLGTLLLVSAAFSTPGPAYAEPGSLSGYGGVQSDNDTARFAFGLTPGSDEQFTNGINVRLVLPQEGGIDLNSFSGRLATLLFPENPPGYAAVGFVFGQTMYTPVDLRRYDVDLTDRPYGAWLRGGIVQFYVWPSAKAHMLSLEVDAGVIGPAAGGYEVQSAVHKILRGGSADGDPPEPRGWSNQVGRSGNFAGVSLVATDQRVLLEMRGLQLTRETVVNFGNVFVSGALGVFFRAGYLNPGLNPITSPGGVQFIPPAESVAGVTTSPPGPPTERTQGTLSAPRIKNYEVYLFGRVQPRLTVYNVFVDGGGGSHGLSLMPIGLDTELGIGFRIRRVIAKWSYYVRSSETLDKPPANNRSYLFAHAFIRLEAGVIF